MSLLVTIDFSSVTDAQLDIVDRLASPNREIHLLHVTEPDPSFVGLEAGPEEVQRQVATELEQAQAELEALADRLRCAEAGAARTDDHIS